MTLKYYRYTINIWHILISKSSVFHVMISKLMVILINIWSIHMIMVLWFHPVESYMNTSSDFTLIFSYPWVSSKHILQPLNCLKFHRHSMWQNDCGWTSRHEKSSKIIVISPTTRWGILVSILHLFTNDNYW